MTDHLAMVLVMLLFMALLLCVVVIVGGGASLFRSGSARGILHRIGKSEHRRHAA